MALYASLMRLNIKKLHNGSKDNHISCIKLNGNKNRRQSEGKDISDRKPLGYFYRRHKAKDINGQWKYTSASVMI